MVITVLSYFGEDWHRSYPDPWPCSGFSLLKPYDSKVSQSDGLISLGLINDAGVKVNLEQVNVSVFGSMCRRSVINKDMRAGSIYLVNVTDCDFPVAGKYFRADITIVYTKLNSSIPYNSVGECHGTVGK